jgi:ATP/maltotriose-dependent transcriptional regulator MalT
MLETVRELATERLAELPTRDDIEQRHAKFFGDLVSTAPWPLHGQDEWSDRLRLDDGNVRRAVRWFFDHDSHPLPQMFRVLWWFWQQNDRMREGRAWLEELLPRADELNEQELIDLYLTAAVTGIEVGDDDGSLSAAREIEQLQDRIDDPFLASWAQLALAWTRPISGDYDGALTAGYRALDGFRALGESFMEGAALMTVGMLELGQGHKDLARPFLSQVQSIGAQFRNNWLASGGQVQFALIATQEGRFDEAHALLQDAMDAADQTQIATHTLSFCLVALAQLALAEGDPTKAATALGAAEGARQRAGIRAWPSLRRGETLLIEQVRDKLGSSAFDEVFARGFALDRNSAVALLRAQRDEH